MNPSKAILLGLILASAFLALGFAAQARRGEDPFSARNNRFSRGESALAADVARVRAASALAAAPGAASLFHLCP